jgi:hypothetical protein
VSSSLPGYPDRPPTSLVPPLLQVALGAALLLLAWWSAAHARGVRATDVFAWNALAAITVVAGLLWMPYALVALGLVVRNRRRRRRTVGTGR